MRTDYGDGHNKSQGSKIASRSNRTNPGVSAIWTLMGAALLVACAHDGEGVNLESGGGDHDGALNVDLLWKSLSFAGAIIIFNTGGSDSTGGGSGPGSVAQGTYTQGDAESPGYTPPSGSLRFSDPGVSDNPNSELSFRIHHGVSTDSVVPATPQSELLQSQNAQADPTGMAGTGLPGPRIPSRFPLPRLHLNR